MMPNQKTEVKKLNKQSKEQSANLFKLSIAIAIVVVGVIIALPYLLLPIIEHDGFDPTDTTRIKLIELYNKPGVWKETRDVKFSTYNPILSKEAVVLNTALTPEQICFSLGDYAGSKEWELTETKLKYKGSASRLVQLGIICNKGKAALEDDVREVVPDAVLESCGCSEEQTCCAIVLKRG